MKKLFKGQKLPCFVRCTGFSLVEMLMALLVASLLLAALAPVMTRKTNEHITVSGTGGGAKSDYSRTFYEDFEWAVPNGVNVINVTSVGGGGAGGGATYGFKEITSSETNWTVPEGVTKLRVFMIGAGGGGASGGLNTDFDYADIPAINNAEWQQINMGTYTFANNVAVPDTYIAPALTARCSDSSITQWTVASDNTTISPNAKFSKFLNNISLTKVTACGAGGGAAGTVSLGGSGGYLVNNPLNVTAPASSITVKVGSPGGAGVYTGASIKYALVVAGGAGGAGGTAGTAGARGDCNGTSLTACDATSSGGGGGSTAILNAGTMVFEAPGGGGGGGGGAISSFPCADTNAYSYSNVGGGNGGGSFNRNYGLGGGGGQAWCNGRGLIAGSGASGYIAGANGSAGGNRANGGSGGGGIGGVGGGKGTLSSIFGTSKCNAGCSGAIKLWYSVASVTNGLKCQYYAKSNSGGGGGAGQIWIGEISVTPGQKLNFNIGIGGEGTSSYGNNGYGRNGGDGGSTSISAGSSALISVSGGKGGKYESSDNEAYINNTYGMGGGIKTTSATVGSNVIKYVNWKGSNFHTGGENGGSAKSYNNGGGGGKGGQLYNLNGVLVKGGVEGGAQSNGGDALSSSYGAGGGGGGGIVNDGKRPGHGGKGANGYIYIEWGSTNGGGGASGQIASYNGVWVTPGTKVQITVGKGGEAPAISTAGNVQQGLKGNNGGDSFITTNEGKKAVAKGGEGGYAGSSSHGKGGNYDNSVTDSIKGEDGSDDYGGIGGTITPDMCPLFDSLMGLGGCGGNMPNGNCNGAYSSGVGKNAGKTGGGGGGGAINNGTAYTGGKGADGMVVIEWNN